jgi:DNA-binding transcriptional LysR family regulator
MRRFMRHGMLPQLLVFESIARLGSFTRAADALCLAQPTVSTQMRKLSDTLGLVLVEQIGKKVYLTDAGRAVYQGCAELLATFERLDDALAGLRGLEAGRLCLAVSTTGKYFAPRLLAAFVAQHPGVEVSLQIHNRQALIDRLQRNDDDLYIFANPPQDQDLVLQPILRNPMVVFAHVDHPLARERQIPLAVIANEPFIMREPGSGTRLVAYEAFEQHRLAPKVRIELSTNEAVKQAILAGLGVSVLSRYTLGLDTEQRQLAILDVVGFPIERWWQFTYPVGKQISPVARAFLNFVRSEAKTLVEDHIGHEAAA